ncbi:MAG: HAD-IA family hydrolase [Planctomycetes bacterium]|nr:HAD-IA family hydrolase [Planctomycetota bacterium]
MYPSLLFDLDGTLIDSARDISASVNHTRKHFGFAPLSGQEVLAAIGDGVVTLLQRTVPIEGEEPVKVYREHHREHCLDTTVLYPGVAEMLAELSARKVALAVVTNKPTEFTIRILDALGVLQYFRACVGGDTAAGKKPKPGPVLRALENLGRAPWDALMVGDSPGDIVAGQSAGTASCAVGWGFRSLELLAAARPDHVIHRVEDLLALGAGAAGAPRTVYEAVGEETFWRIARAFYARIDGDARIRSMFPPKLDAAIEHQALFFTQFFGGPGKYSEKRGAPRLRMRHAPFPIDAAASQAWLENMLAAIEESKVPEPAAGVIRRYCAHTARFLVNQ